jgi:uncharacterized membrane-anchored protein
MKVKLAVAVAALQVLVLAFMAGQREWIARTGTPLVLRTAPIDPNDPMRGAYVRLDYEISVVPAALCRGEVAKWTQNTSDYHEMRKLRDHVVYATLQKDNHGIAEITGLSEAPPDNNGAPFIKGRVVSVDQNGVRVRYGIEALFMSKDAAVRTENMALREKVGAPMNVRVAVGSNGTAVLRDFEWEPLGITIALDRPPRRENNDPQRWQPQPTTGMTVTLHNYSDKEVAIVSQPEGRWFRMVPNTRMSGNNYAPISGPSAGQANPAATDIIVLKPGAKHEVHLDLTQPRWWVTDTRKPGSDPLPLQKIPQQDAWSSSFRLEYTPPSAESVRGLPHADLLRHTPLRSRAFNANQGVD